MKESRIRRKHNKANSSGETEPNRTRRTAAHHGNPTSGKRQKTGSDPVKAKAERTNNAPSKRRNESSNRRHQEGGRS